MDRFQRVQMNNVFFYCRNCRTYTDAGYRWCLYTLEKPGILRRGKPIDVDRVLGAQEYWSGGGAKWLTKELLPEIKNYLSQHREHDLCYGEQENFIDHRAGSPQAWTEV